MDMTPACLIFTPIFLPVCQALGMNTIHFGIMLIFNLCIGTITPPVGTTLFVGVKVGGVKIETVFKQLIAYFAAIFAVLMLVTYVRRSAWLCQSDGLCENKMRYTPICSAPPAGTPAAGFFFALFLLERVDSRGQDCYNTHIPTSLVC